MENFFNIDSQYNLHLPSGVYLRNIPTIPGTTTTVLVAGADGQISTATVDQLTASESAVTSVFGRIGAVVAQAGDYTTTQITEGTNLYFTQGRARGSISLTTTGTTATYNTSTGVLNIPQYLTAFTETDPIWIADKPSYATKVYVDTTVANLVDSAPTTLDTLNELAAALGDDPNFATTITTLIGTKEPAITAGTTAQYWRGDKTWQTLPIYTLPKASATVLGGIKVGANLTIDADGVLAAGNSYVLPTASASVLGGIKVGTNLSIDANGVLSSSYTDTNTTYSLTVPNATTKIRLSGSDTVNSDITLTAGDNVTITRTSATEITIASSYIDTNTVTRLRRIDSDGATNPSTYRSGDLTLRPGNNVTITEPVAGVYQIASSFTDTNTTYGLSVPSSTTTIRLAGSDAVNNDVKLTAGSNITVTRTSSSEITIDSSYVDTNTVTSIRRIDADGTTGGTTYRTGNITLRAGTNVAITETTAGVFQFVSSDTTYSVFTGATASVAGTTGLVPASAAGDQLKFLRADGTWVVPTDTDTNTITQIRRIDADNTTGATTYRTGNITLRAGTNVAINETSAGVFQFVSSDTTYAVFTAATNPGGTLTPGTNGLVPGPTILADNSKFLKGDGTWAVPTDTNTWQANTKDVDGYVSAPGAVANKVWKTDSSGNPGWRTDADTTYSVFTAATNPGGVVTAGANGLVPGPAVLADNAKFLRGDGTWQTPTDTNTWIANTKDDAGYVAAPGAVANRVWKTDANGNPGWRDDADTDTNTTYSAGTGLTLTGTTFSVTKTITTAATADTIALRDANANLTAAGFFQSSSRLLKRDINPYKESALDILKRTNIVSFYYKTDLENRRIGFIAEDTPEELSTKDKNVMDANSTIGLLIKAVQELEARIKQLEDEK